MDKWLWATRVFKTRSQAIAACDAGHVKLAGQNLKPAHRLRGGEVLTVQLERLQRTVRVVGLVERRVGASLLPSYLEDLTPPEEQQKTREGRLEPLFHRPKGLGRPTKRDRRLLDRMRGPPLPE